MLAGGTYKIAFESMRQVRVGNESRRRAVRRRGPPAALLKAAAQPAGGRNIIILFGAPGSGKGTAAPAMVKGYVFSKSKLERISF